MNIIVCINQIPDTTSKINVTPDNQHFDPTGVQFIINPSDESALTKALQIKEKTGGNITLITVGKADAEPVLRKAFAIGATKMIRIDAEPLDGLFVAKELAKVIENQSFDLIFCGKESLDYHGGMVGGMLATLLNIDFIDDVMAFSVEDKKASVEREIDNGKEILEANFPLLVAVQKEVISENELRIPNMRGIMAARQAPIEVIAPSGSNSATKIVSMEKPAPKLPVKMISADALDELIHELQNVKKVL